mmetsp:Transcript_102038/g.202573  ORF Transcript_102038/g.202573 Transcript_102038/m.202573 type:complete len:94 (-) Transcript_102038:2095-2376(-)
MCTLGWGAFETLLQMVVGRWMAKADCVGLPDPATKGQAVRGREVAPAGMAAQSPANDRRVARKSAEVAENRSLKEDPQGQQRHQNVVGLKLPC